MTAALVGIVLLLGTIVVLLATMIQKGMTITVKAPKPQVLVQKPQPLSLPEAKHLTCGGLDLITVTEWKGMLVGFNEHGHGFTYDQGQWSRLERLDIPTGAA